jgi:U3 small nucleolar RNA-associated protein 14
MNIDEQFEKLVSSDLTEGSKWLKYSDLLLAKIHAIEKHGAKSAEVKKLDTEIKKEMNKLGITEAVSRTGSSGTLDLDELEKKPRLSIKYWEKLFKGKAEEVFDGIHGYIVIIRVSSIITRHESSTFENLTKGPEYRWIEFDDKYIKIGF